MSTHHNDRTTIILRNIEINLPEYKKAGFYPVTVEFGSIANAEDASIVIRLVKLRPPPASRK